MELFHESPACENSTRTAVFLVYAQIFRWVCIPTKYKWQVGYSTEYHLKACYLMPSHRTYSHANTITLGAAHDTGRMGVMMLSVTTTSYSGLLYFLWHGINNRYQHTLCLIIKTSDLRSPWSKSTVSYRNQGNQVVFLFWKMKLF